VRQATDRCAPTTFAAAYPAAVPNRSQRRAQYRSAARPITAQQRRNRFRILVVLAVFGLILLAVASFGTISVPAPTPSPLL